MMMSGLVELKNLTISYRSIRDELNNYIPTFNDFHLEYSFLKLVDFKIIWNGAEYILIVSICCKDDVDNWFDKNVHKAFMEKYNVKLSNYSLLVGCDYELKLKYYDKNSSVNKNIDINQIKEIGGLLD